MVPPGLRMTHKYPINSEWDPRGYSSFRRTVPLRDLASSLYEFHRFGTFKRGDNDMSEDDFKTVAKRLQMALRTMI